MTKAPKGSGRRAKKTLKKAEVMESAPEKPLIYRDDVVKCGKYGDILGIVMEAAGDYDSYDSSDDYDDDEDEYYWHGTRGGGGGGGRGRGGGGGGFDGSNMDYDEDDDVLPDGKAAVRWTDGYETVDDMTDITVVDRNFVLGDVVASASDPTGQLGVVMDVNKIVDLKAANGDIIKGVSSKDLTCIRKFSEDDFVVMGPWLGQVEQVFENVTVAFDDGSACIVYRADNLELLPAQEPPFDETNCPYYPGQRVRAASSSFFKHCKWLSGFWKKSFREGTIVKLETDSVDVYWKESAYRGTDTDQVDFPAKSQKPKNLAVLSCISYADWQLGDWCLLPSPPQTASYGNDASTSVELTESSGVPLNIPEAGQTIKGKKAESSGVVSTDASCVELGSGHIVDGPCRIEKKGKQVDESSSNKSGENKESEHIISKEPAEHKKQHKVRSRRAERKRKRDKKFESALWIVNTMTKVDVVWQDATREYQLDSTSLIPIRNPNDHEFFPDDYVVDKSSNDVDNSSEGLRVGIVRRVNSKERTACVRWLKPVSRPDEPKEFDCEEVLSAYELDGHPDHDYNYGYVVARLPSVSNSSETANFGSIVENQDESSTNFTNLSWIGNIIGFQDGDIKVKWGDGTVSKVGHHEVYVVYEEDDEEWSESESFGSDGSASWETAAEDKMEVDDSEKEVDQKTRDLVHGENDGAAEEKDELKTKDSFKHFDIAQNPVDHHFITGNGEGTSGRKWTKKVQQEWNVLEKDLPDAIYVRVFEDRMDLIRAVIVGASETPYQDGLFFFDFKIPPEYPQVPPVAFYHSGGLELNPNLYPDGKVCLSLLHTWDGNDGELWDSSYSTILQVLVSLQGLVLNSKPYFNEPGYEKQIGSSEGEKNSLSFNENTYLMSLRSMLYLLRRPPMHFEDFVKDHFRKRGLYILKACEAYLGGSCIGSLTEEACTTEKSREHSCSTGFKLTLAKNFATTNFSIKRGWS
uniref:E2 ubiquitin-conjugating enzyme n=1 Tax=Ananas comosus var. bracteatus TaxID=296719 RepID=A0A6V7QMU6_ANACO|nr:unnamed protein product [Ananas comosus var. bracteatus]